jgi:hypothetical protein|tara:strand:+ start:293 stop:505 length:213 start_codon:yes stop_codon:yes gene_type:complete
MKPLKQITTEEMTERLNAFDFFDAPKSIGQLTREILSSPDVTQERLAAIDTEVLESIEAYGPQNECHFPA